MWAGMSSGPSSVCVHPPKSSGTAALNHVSKSRRTSGEAFSLMRQRRRGVADEEVAQADLELGELGQRALDLARDEVKAAGTGLERDLALQPHRP